ncbi:MAG: SCP2 sterol-binding domain-containing protein [Chloroflexi bacterium]|nr:SCP2 sterol-binding domain-containing protein [Chloroflexota bacterium]
MTTPADIFAKTPQNLIVDKAGDMNAAVAFDLSGDQGGQWTVKIADGSCAVEDGIAESVTATINMDGSDYVDMMTGKLNPMMAFMGGKVKVSGDLNTVMKFQTMFKIG